MVHVTKIQNIGKKFKKIPKLLAVKFSWMPLLTTPSSSSVPPPLTPPVPHSPALPHPLLCVTTIGSPLHISRPCLPSSSPCPTQLCPQPQRAPWCRVPDWARGTVGLQTGPDTCTRGKTNDPVVVLLPLPGWQVEGGVSSRDMLAMTLLAFSQ